MELRPYQRELNEKIDAAYASGARNVLAVLPCGAGKTALFSYRLAQHDGASCCVAHRQELVSQMSLTLAKYGVRHRIIGPQNVIRWIIQLQIQELGRDFYDPTARCAVAGVDTLIRRADELGRWAQQVTQFVIDEGKHVAGAVNGDPSTGNKWCKAIAMFPNARGLLVDATPERADGKGLGRHADGVVDAMVEGPSARQLITGLPNEHGVITQYLSDYKIACVASDLDLSDVAKGVDGDYIRSQLALKTRKSNIMGHVVETYLKLTPGKLGVTFAPDVETATEFSKMFNDAGVPSEMVCAKTPDKLRVEILRRFKNRQLLQLVNVDLFSEGFDLPAIEVVSMARATESYSLYHQQFMRACRMMEGKTHAYILDHVGAVIRHGLPDRVREWSLDRRERKSSEKDPNVIPMRVCTNQDVGGSGIPCFQPYERVLPACPFCGHTPVPAVRSTVEQVDGDMQWLDPEVLSALRGEVAAVNRPVEDVMWGMRRAGYSELIVRSQAKTHRERHDAQTDLRETMAAWMGYQKAFGRDIPEAQKRFFFRFDTDVLSAQAFGRPDAESLTQKICDDLVRLDNELRGAAV